MRYICTYVYIYIYIYNQGHQELARVPPAEQPGPQLTTDEAKQTQANNTNITITHIIV